MHARDASGTGPGQGVTGAGLSRRGFLAAVGGTGAALALCSSPWLAAMAASAREAARDGRALVCLSPAQARTLAAALDRIIPAVDDLPGAMAAGAVHFADLALAGPFADAQPQVRAGLADLDARARRLQPRVADFGALEPSAQDRLLRAVEKTPFFGLVSALAIFGTLSAPQYGGNRNGVGWKLVQIEPHMRWQPPFGWYDAQVAHPQPGIAS